MIILYRPEYLFLLFFIPILIFIHITSIRTSKKRAIKFANFEAIRRINGVEIFSKNITLLYLNIAIVLFLAFSLAGMGYEGEVESSKLSFVLLIDSSVSMGAQDLLPSRFEIVQKSSVDFLKMVPQKTEMAVVSFSNNPIIESEITEDKNALKNALNSIRLSSSGTSDILSGIIAATNLLVNKEQKAIVLFSDGGLDANSLQLALDYAKKSKIKVYSFGVGTSEGGRDKFGGVYKFSEDLLRIIAENSGGKYYSIQNIDDFYYSLGDIIEVVKKKEIVSLSEYFLLIGIFLIILNFYLSNNRFRIFP